MSKYKELNMSYNNPMNDQRIQYHLIQEALREKYITIDQAIDIMFGKDLVQAKFDQDLKSILEEDND